jgi:hypothetical protein
MTAISDGNASSPKPPVSTPAEAAAPFCTGNRRLTLDDDGSGVLSGSLDGWRGIWHRIFMDESPCPARIEEEARGAVGDRLEPILRIWILGCNNFGAQGGPVNRHPSAL